MRKILPLAALLLAAGLAWGEQKVRDGGTPPASGQTAQERAAAEKEHREAAKKALRALKGQPDKDKRDERKPGGR